MTVGESISLCACIGHLAVGFLVMARGARNAMAMPVALLCVDFFIWNFATWAYEVSGQQVWLWLDATFSPFTVPLALHVILTFVQANRRLRMARIAFYAVFGALSLSSALAFFSPAAREWVLSDAWALVFLAGILAMMGVAVGALSRHLAVTTNHDEQVRARLLVAAVLLGGALGSTELWDRLLGNTALGALGPEAFGAREFGALVATSVIAIVVLRFRLLGRDLSSSVALYAVLLALLGTVGYLAAFRFLGTDMALLVVGITSASLLLVAATWDIVTRLLHDRERKTQLVTLGRFSAQMNHDLKNPLAAMKGALQFLAEEHRQGRSLENQGEFLTLAIAQVDRLERTIDRYQRLGRIEPVFEAGDVNDLVRDVLALSSLSTYSEDGQTEVTAELGETLPPCRLDPDLLQGALENIVHNALQATTDGGSVRIETRACEEGLGRVTIVVIDTGRGMDARQQQRAFDDFYTTRADGSGLGLAFARRVLDAHGGEVSLASALGEGTTVTLTLPGASHTGADTP